MMEAHSSPYFALCTSKARDNALGMPQTPGRLKRIMDVLPSPFYWLLRLISFRAGIKFSQNTGKHTSHVCSLLLILHKAGVRFDLERRNFFTEDIDYHGRVILLSNL